MNNYLERKKENGREREKKSSAFFGATDVFTYLVFNHYFIKVVWPEYSARGVYSLLDLQSYSNYIITIYIYIYMCVCVCVCVS